MAAVDPIADRTASGPAAADAETEPVDDKDRAYFGYYAQFAHQQNMLQDAVRTSAYFHALAMNGDRLAGRRVMDLGAGSGILSYFAVRQGAAHVWAVEASGMARQIQRMVDAAAASASAAGALTDAATDAAAAADETATDAPSPSPSPSSPSTAPNAWLAGRITVVNALIERWVPPSPDFRVDVLISEPIGVLVLHERMCESFLVARDRFLAPGGAMIPNASTIRLAPFTDAPLWTQTAAKLAFWQARDFYGIDLAPLAPHAMDEVFEQPVVGCFDPRILMAAPCSHVIDFTTITLEAIRDITIPVEYTMQYTGILHGLAGWFDVDLAGVTLSTAPAEPKTHWQQIRFLLKEPLAVNMGQRLVGWVRLTANALRSYDVALDLLVCDAETPDAAAQARAVVMASCRRPSAPASTATGAAAAAPFPDPGMDGPRRPATRRQGVWGLHQQIWFESPPMDYTRSEYLALYTPAELWAQQQQQPPPSSSTAAAAAAGGAGLPATLAGTAIGNAA